MFYSMGKQTVAIKGHSTNLRLSWSYKSSQVCHTSGKTATGNTQLNSNFIFLKQPKLACRPACWLLTDGKTGNGFYIHKTRKSLLKNYENMKEQALVNWLPRMFKFFTVIFYIQKINELHRYLTKPIL